MNYFEKYLSYNKNNISAFFFWKGRVALYAILKAYNIMKDDEVILPAFTCVVVPNVIKYLKAKPVYVDVDSSTYNIDYNKIKRKITGKTKVIITQNTFGLSPDLDPIMLLGKKYKLSIIEDCAHGFGGSYKDSRNGTITDSAFFSTQWNKAFSTGIGGIAVTKDKEIAKSLKDIESIAVKPGIKEQMSLRFQIIIKDYFLNNSMYWFALRFYRWLSRNNIITGSSQGYELEKPVMHPGFLKGFSKFQFKRLNKELHKIEDNLSHRKRVADIYKNKLRDLKIGVPYEPDYAMHTFVKFPLIVENRQRFLDAAEKSRIEIGDWFLSPLHPVTDNLNLWDYCWGENPIAEWLSQHIVNLPTHRGINGKQVIRIESFLASNKGNIIPYEEVSKIVLK